MENRKIPLPQYCRENGISRYQIYMLLQREVQSGIIASGAIKRLGGRWLVDPAKMDAYMEGQAMEWAESHAAFVSGPRRKKISPPRRAKVGA